MLLFPLSLCSWSPSLPWQWLHAWAPTLPPITYRRKLYSPGGCFPLFKAAKGPAFLSAILMAYLTVYPTFARVFGKPFPICYKVLDYISPTILSHWPSKYLCTNFLIGAFRWNKSKSNSDPIIPVRQPCKILQAKSESTYLTLKFGWCWSQQGRLEYLKKSHFQFIKFLRTKCYQVRIFLPSLVSQRVKNLPAMQDTWIWSLGWEDPLEKGVTTHSSILAWRIPWTEEPGRLQPMG